MALRFHLRWICIREKLHNIGVSSGSISDVVEGSAFDGYVGRVDSASTCGGELASLKFADIELVVAPVISAVVEVDVSVSAGAVDAVVGLFGGELDGAGLHGLNKIITRNVSKTDRVLSINII